MKKWLNIGLNLILGIFFAFSFKLAGMLAAWILSLCKINCDNPTLRIIAGGTWAVISVAVILLKKDSLSKAFRFSIERKEGKGETVPEKIISFLLAFIFGISLNRIITVLINVLPLPTTLTAAAEKSVSTAVDSENVILILIAVWIVSPIVEELSFRGLSYFYLESAWGKWPAFIITCIIFGACHGNYLQGAYAIIAAVFCCIFIRLTGSVLAGVLMHMGFNGSNLILSQIVNANISDNARTITDIILALLAVLTFAAIIMLSKVEEK